MFKDKWTNLTTVHWRHGSQHLFLILLKDWLYLYAWHDWIAGPGDLLFLISGMVGRRPSSGKAQGVHDRPRASSCLAGYVSTWWLRKHKFQSNQMNNSIS